MTIKFARLTFALIQIVQMQVIFSHLKMWVAVARHNNKWVKINYITWRFTILKPEFTIIIFIHYKPRIAVAILVL